MNQKQKDVYLGDELSFNTLIKRVRRSIRNDVTHKQHTALNWRILRHSLTKSINTYHFHLLFSDG
jgi:hypothetical protein